MLKMAPNFVLPSFERLNVHKSTPRRSNSVRPRWMAILSIPQSVWFDMKFV